MSTRAQLDVQLDQLARMLPPWLEKLRHEAQFWPQFNALAQRILEQAEVHDQAHVRQRLDAMLAEHHPIEPAFRVECSYHPARRLGPCTR